MTEMERGESVGETREVRWQEVRASIEHRVEKREGLGELGSVGALQVHDSRSKCCLANLERSESEFIDIGDKDKIVQTLSVKHPEIPSEKLEYSTFLQIHNKITAPSEQPILSLSQARIRALSQR
jgi:hypothetical protein